MAKRINGAVLRQLGTLFNLGAVGEATDGQLLERFASREGEAAELAFAALVERHGSMVLRVCRSILGDEHDAQDAFQATFLVLVRKARRLWVRDSLGPWLHQVAYRAACGARSARSRRVAHERRAAGRVAERVVAGGDGEDLGGVLHEEIERLPGRYRAVIVLCDLEGRTHEQAARHLGCPAGTVKSRLARGRQQLRGRLARRGLAPSAGLGVALSSRAVRAAVPSALVDETVQTALHCAAGSSVAVVQAAALSIAGDICMRSFTNKLKMIAVATMAIGIAASGASVLARQKSRGGPSDGVGREERPVGVAMQTVEDRRKDFAVTVHPNELKRLSDQLQGLWDMTEVEPVQGATFARAQGVSWLIDGQTVTILIQGKEVGQSKLALIVGERDEPEPVAIDLIKVHDDATVTVERGLLRLEGDTLKLCTNHPDGPRPSAFEASDSGPWPSLVVFKRRVAED